MTIKTQLLIMLTNYSIMAIPLMRMLKQSNENFSISSILINLKIEFKMASKSFFAL